MRLKTSQFYYIKNRNVGQWCGSAGSAVACDRRSSRFKYQHRQFFYQTGFTVYCCKVKNNEKRQEMSDLKNAMSATNATTNLPCKHIAILIISGFRFHRFIFHILYFCDSGKTFNENFLFISSIFCQFWPSYFFLMPPMA